MSEYIDKFNFITDGEKTKTVPIVKSKISDKKVLFMGDSLTFGRVGLPEGGYDTSKNPYPNVFCDLMGVEDFYNSAVPGATVCNDSGNSWMNQYTDVAQIASYDIIFFMFGTNDFLSNKTIGNRYNYSLGNHTFLKDAYQTLQRLTIQCKAAEIICLLPPYIQRSKNNFGLTMQDYRNAMAWVAGMFNIPVIDMSIIGFNSSNASYLMSDTTHFNDISYNMLGQYLANMYKSNYHVNTDYISKMDFPIAHNTIDSSFFSSPATITDHPLYSGYYVDVNGTVTTTKAVFLSSSIPLLLKFNTVNTSNLRSMKVQIGEEVYNVPLNPSSDFVSIRFVGSGGSGNISFITEGGTVRISNIYFGVDTPFVSV